MAKKLQIIVAFLIFGIGVYYKNHWVLGSLTLIILIFSIRKYRKDKKELEEAKFYCRVNTEKTWTSYVVPVLVLAAIFFVSFYYSDVLETYLSGGVLLYIILIQISMFLANHYNRFTSAVRSFKNGIIIPQNGGDFLKWKDIAAFELLNQELSVSTIDEKKFTYLIDHRDLEDVENIRSEILK